MNSILIIGTMLLIHWIGDFVFQTDEQAKGKSTNIIQLLSHTIVYGLTILVGISLLDLFNVFGAQYWWTVWLFSGIQFVTHTMIDFVTSKINSSLWKQGRTHYFFVSIGFDQFLHLLILFSSIDILFF